MLPPVDDLKYIADCQQMLVARELLLQLHSQPEIETFLKTITDFKTTHLQWARRLAWVDLLTRFYLPQLYAPEDPPSRWHDISLRWLPSVPNEQHMLTDGSLHTLVSNNSLAPLWTAIAKLSQDHADALNAVLETRISGNSQSSGMPESEIPSKASHT